MPKKLTPEEVKRVNESARDFIRKMNAVPETGRILLTSDKFSGPIGLKRVDPDPEIDVAPERE